MRNLVYFSIRYQIPSIDSDTVPGGYLALNYERFALHIYYASHHANYVSNKIRHGSETSKTEVVQRTHGTVREGRFLINILPDAQNHLYAPTT